ncbi:MAG TPA: EamA family transporter [Xanthobacteraceae bacterium]|nr:EamA family transporter [Xanthobacteraceae bacterium]
MLGVLLAALSAATFAFNNASARRGVLTGSVAQALAITVPIGVPIFFLAALATGTLGILGRFSGEAIALLALAGVLHFVVGRYGNFRAAQAIGANLSGPVIQLSLALTLTLAVLVLREPLTPLRILGIVLLALAPLLMREARADAPVSAQPSDTPVQASAPPKFVPRYAEGYAFALLAALVYGITPFLIRLAVIRGDLGSGIAGGLISYAAATAAVALLLLWPGQWRHAREIGPESLKWFTYSGVSVSIAQMFIYMAYAVAPLSVVTPILQLHHALRLVFSRLLNPHHEIFGGRMILATALSLLGAVALSLDVEHVLALVPLPESLAAFARWHWP